MSRIEKAREFRKRINTNLQATRKLIRVDELDEEELLEMVDLYESYQVGKQYKEGIDSMNNYNTEKEIWKDIEGFESIYQVSSIGRVKRLAGSYGNNRKYSVNEDKILSLEKMAKGYERVQLNYKLTERVVQIILRLSAFNKLSHEEIGKVFDVSKSTINHVVSGKNWGYLYK